MISCNKAKCLPWSLCWLEISSYTYCKVLDIASDAESGTVNAWNFKQDRGPPTFDIWHYWTTSWIYEVPFERGKHFGSGSNTLANKFIAEWQLGRILPADESSVLRKVVAGGCDSRSAMLNIDREGDG